MEENNNGLELALERLQSWWEALLLNLPNIILAILVLILGIALARVMKKYFRRLAFKVTKQETVAGLMTSVATAIFVLLVIFLVLTILNLSTALTSILAGAGVVGLAIGLAFQDPLLNLFSGIMISTRDYFNVGDLVEIDGRLGKVRRISLRSTFLESLQGQEVVIPNNTVVSNHIVNYGILNKRRVDLACGVSYGDDLEKVRDLTIRTIKDKIDIDSNKPVQLFFNEFGNSSINYTLRFWLKTTGQADYLSAQSEAIMAIKKAYDENDIMIPFPIRTLDFGIKGGEKLSEMLQGSSEHPQPNNGHS